MWEVGAATMSQHVRNCFCPSSLFETSKSSRYAGTGRFARVVWSVTLFANWRKLILVIQTDGALSKFVFRDDLTLLGPTIL